MGRDFKSFKYKPEDKKNVEDVIKTYEGKSENELMDEIVNKYSEGISNGSVSREELDRFLNNAKSYLAPDQVKKLQAIVNKLKKI